MDQIDAGWEEGETRLDRVLETVVEGARSLVDAKTVMVLLEDRAGLLVVAATTGEFKVERREFRLQADGSAWRHVMSEGEAERMAPIETCWASRWTSSGIAAEAALLVPLSYRGRWIRHPLQHSITSGTRRGTAPRTNRSSLGFAASAAMALAAAQSMAEARLRESIDVTERGAARWARELHDETLQGLGALHVPARRVGWGSTPPR